MVWGIKRVIRTFFMIILIILILSLITHPSSAIRSYEFQAEFVTYVHSFGKYIPRWNNVFAPGEKINLYVSVENINVGRAGAVDFVYVITDPKGFIISGGEKTVRIIGYEDKYFYVFEIDTDEDWTVGKYRLDVFAFDVLNFNRTFGSYGGLNYRAPYTGEAGVDISTYSRGSAYTWKRGASYVFKNLEFIISKKPKVPEDQLLVYDSYLKATELPAGVSNFLHVTVLNTISAKGEGVLELVIDGKPAGRKTVTLDGYKKTDVNFEIPPLSLGVHTLEVIPRTDNIKLSETLPIFVSPLVFKKDILFGEVYNGSVIYSPNNYVLGSLDITEIKDVSNIKDSLKGLRSKENARNSMKMFTNILAYLWSTYQKEGLISVGLLKGSDSRADLILPELLDFIRSESGAPISYFGVVDYDEANQVSVLFYVGSKSPDVRKLENFFRNGGFLIVDNTGYWSDPFKELKTKLETMRGWKGFEVRDEMYGAYYDLYIDKVITITTREKVEIPSEFRISGLKVSDFIVNVGQPVDISFKVKNSGREGDKEIRVFVNNEVVYEEKIHLKPNEERTITFQYVPSEEGSYKVQIEDTDLAQVFFAKMEKSVETPTPTPAKEGTTPKRGGEFVIGSAVLLAVLVIARIFMKE